MSKAMKTWNVFVSTYQGLEEELAKEVNEVLNDEVAEIRRRGVAIPNRMLPEVYKLNYYLRLGLRVQIELERFELKETNDLYQKGKEIKWEDWFDVANSFKIDVNANNSELFKHSKYAGQLLKDAICDRFRDLTGERPNIDTKTPDIWIHLQISSNNCTISLNSSGDSLHRRGYKLRQTPAPISEVLAAGIIKLSGWEGNTPFYDGMCGSGTFLAEAFMLMDDIPAGRWRRRFSFKRWKCYEQEDFELVRRNIRIPSKKIYVGGSDIHPGSISAAQLNLKDLFKGRKPQVKQADFFNLEKPFKKGILIMNPPYDVRLKDKDIREFYKKLGDQLKQHWQGWDAWIYSGNIDALKNLGLKPKQRIPLWNGPIEGRLMHFPLF